MQRIVKNGVPTVITIQKVEIEMKKALFTMTMVAFTIMTWATVLLADGGGAEP
jgi:hypothetical protein